jgi:transmembrane sensor
MEKEKLTKKWLANELNDDERKTFEQHESNKLLKRIVDNAPSFSASNFSSAKEFEALKMPMKSVKRSKKVFPWFKPLLKIASILVIGFGLYFLFFFNASIHIETRAGENITVQLPDLSEVVLNAVSKISYSDKTWNDKREVKLDGEAFFKVAKGSTFDVLTTIGKVSVVGTHFNVKNRRNLFKVICFEGKVIVTYKGKTKELLKHDSFRVINGIISFDSIENRQEPYWINHTSNFEKAPIQVVVEELERQYNVKITVKNIDKNLIFTGGFTHNNLKDALESISLPLNLKYVMETPTKISLHNSD